MEGVSAASLAASLALAQECVCVFLQESNVTEAISSSNLKRAHQHDTDVICPVHTYRNALAYTKRHTHTHTNTHAHTHTHTHAHTHTHTHTHKHTHAHAHAHVGPSSR